MKELQRTLMILSALATVPVNSAWALDAAANHRDATFTLDRHTCKHLLHGAIWLRSELFFGLSRSSGPNVTEEEFQEFVDSEVTPRFPDGPTLLSGDGQFEDSTGTTIKEGTKLLIVLFPFSRHSSTLIEEIREAYKATFQQESVLRVDEASCLSF